LLHAGSKRAKKGGPDGEDGSSINTSTEQNDYRYPGARVAVMLHEQHLREFLATWKLARDSGAPLPATDDPSYQSYDALLRHVLHWAREYLAWICAQLELPDPDLPPTPDVAACAEHAENHLEILFARWRTPLVKVERPRFSRPEYAAPWQVKYSIDAMLEHAVMHPIRHRFQLLEMIRTPQP
jgi:hypothetical protein